MSLYSLVLKALMKVIFPVMWMHLFVASALEMDSEQTTLAQVYRYGGLGSTL